MLVIGDRHTLKVHLHTDEPGRATALFEEIGDVSHLDVADMTEQVQERSDRLAEAGQACGVLAVVAGTGMRELFEGLGAVGAGRRQHFESRPRTSSSRASTPCPPRRWWSCPTRRT